MNKLKMLIVESHTEHRNNLKFGLEKAFREIDIDESAEFIDTMTKLEQKRYDLIIINGADANLRFLEILKVAREIKTDRKIHILVMLFKESKQDSIAALQAGADGYIVMPFTIDGLMRKIAEFDDKFDRREHQRHGSLGKVSVAFDGNMTEGEIVDISIGGLLLNMSKKSPLPQIIDKVKVSLSSELTGDSLAVEAVVIRIQAIDINLISDQVRFALKFNEIDPAKRDALKDIVEEISAAV